MSRSIVLATFLLGLVGSPAAAGEFSVGDRVWADADGDGLQDGADDERDSDASPPTGRTATFTPTGTADATRWDAGCVHDCAFPDQPLVIVAVGAAVAHGPAPVTTFDLLDPNDPARVTGYRVRRGTLADAPIATWPVAAEFDGLQWEEPASPPPGVFWLYQFSAIDAACDAEGPW